MTRQNTIVVVDSEEMLIRLLKHFREERIVP